MATIGTLAVNIVAKTAKFNGPIMGAQRMLAKFGTSAGAAATAAAGFTAALLRNGEAIERSMQKSIAIMGGVTDMMKNDMTQAAIQVAATTEKSTAQAAEAFGYLASAGLDAEKTLASLPIVARFAQAGNFDLSVATDLAMDSQAALGLAAKDTGQHIANLTRVTDVLVKGNNVANASVEQLANSLTNGAAGAMKLVNMQLEEGVAVLSAYAEVGIKGEKAGTAFAAVMRDLQGKALENRTAFAAAGVSVYDASGKMQKMADIVQDLEKTLAGASDEQVKMTLKTLGFTGESSKFIAALVGMSEKIRQYETDLKNASGAAAKTAALSMTDTQKAMAKLRAEYDKLSSSALLAADRMGAINSLGEGADAITIASGGKLSNVGSMHGTGMSAREQAQQSVWYKTMGLGGYNPLAPWAAGKVYDASAGLIGNNDKVAGAAVNPGWSQKNEALLKSGGQAAIDASIDAQQPKKSTLDVINKWIGGAMGKVEGMARRTGAMAGGTLDSGVNAFAGAQQAMQQSLMQKHLGQLSFGMMGTAPMAAPRSTVAASTATQKHTPTPTLTFARTGSVESYRQRQAIGKQYDADKRNREGNKSEKEMVKLLKEMVKQGKPGELKPANF